jgi:hypothetical protein
VKAPPDAVDELRYATRPLPRTLAPLPGETVDSYLHRLARANLMDNEDLRTVAAGERRLTAPVRPAVLARLSGYPEHTLLRALPELASADPAAPRRSSRPVYRTWTAGPGCRLCNAARGAEPTEPWLAYPEVWHAPADVLCLRHRRWTAGYDENWEQPDLTDQPEILAARRGYLRLARAHGHEAARLAYLTATYVIGEWHDRGRYSYTRTPGFERRILRFVGPKRGTARESAVSQAARYPQIVALTRLLASPYWMGMAVRDHVAAGRPDTARRTAAEDQIVQHRRAVIIATGQLTAPPIPEHLLTGLAETYLLEEGPCLRVFVDEVQRTVEPSYKWNPYPEAGLRPGRVDSPLDPLVQLVQDRAEADQASAAFSGSSGNTPLRPSSTPA